MVDVGIRICVKSVVSKNATRMTMTAGRPDLFPFDEPFAVPDAAPLRHAMCLPVSSATVGFPQCS
jgi:hypothetical protein